MALTDKIADALRDPLRAEYIRLDDDEGISGYVVSSRFEKMSSLDRQRLIDEAIRNAATPLSTKERQQILMIAGLTPLEYESVGTRVRVHRIKTMGDALEVLVHGSPSDAAYVRGALDNQKGVKTTDPQPCPGGVGVLMTFRAKGSQANPLTKEKAIRVLEADPYIEVMPNVESPEESASANKTP